MERETISIHIAQNLSLLLTNYLPQVSEKHSVEKRSLLQIQPPRLSAMD